MADIYDSDSDSDLDESGVGYEDLDNRDSDDDLRFDLYENFSDPALAGQGGLRSYETKKDGTVLYYADRPSDYSITVDRLLWVDGFESTTAEGTHGSEMTLIVLKIGLFSGDGYRFKSFTAKVSFKDEVTGGDHEPIVEAWAPFRTPDRWNPSTAQRELTDTAGGSATAGYEGFVELSGNLTREKKLSWDQVDFDEGTSGEKFSKTTGRRNGVRWAVKQNDVVNRGATPEIWVAVLLSRTSNQPYVVKFRMRSRGGQEGGVMMKRLFGTKPYETKPFSVTPWNRTICHSEGERIMKAIDRNNLGNLRGEWTTDLILPLGPDHRMVPPDESGKPATEAHLPVEGLVHQMAGTREKTTPQGCSAAFATQQHAPQPQSQQHTDEKRAPSTPAHVGGAASLPPSAIRWHNPADPVRLAALESRVAQAEARVATLESTILDLREALFDIKSKANAPRL